MRLRGCGSASRSYRASGKITNPGSSSAGEKKRGSLGEGLGGDHDQKGECSDRARSEHAKNDGESRAPVGYALTGEGCEHGEDGGDEARAKKEVSPGSKGCVGLLSWILDVKSVYIQICMEVFWKIRASISSCLFRDIVLPRCQ